MRIYATIIIDGNIAITTEKLGDMWETLNIPNTKEYTDAKEEIVRNLIAWGYVDISSAYPGHTVKISLS